MSPQITTSLALGASAATSCARSVPAETQVPVISLNCSAMRPANRSPASGLSGSAKVTASPILKKPSSSNASCVFAGSFKYPGVTPSERTLTSYRSPTGTSLNVDPGMGNPTTVWSSQGQYRDRPSATSVDMRPVLMVLR